MFKNEYQGGAFVEIFSAQGKNPGAKWKIFGSPSVIWKEFDKEVKSFVFILEGSSQTNRIQLPKENKQILGLIQRFLVLQIYIPLGQDFSTELLEAKKSENNCNKSSSSFPVINFLPALPTSAMSETADLETLNPEKHLQPVDACLFLLYTSHLLWPCESHHSGEHTWIW